jgi:alcohol dehydrogenase
MQTPQYFEFLHYPKIVSGRCALENIASELAGYNAQKPLVITTKAIVRRGLVKKFIKAFYDSTVVLGGIYDEIRDYAGISQAREAAGLFKARGCDAIIALGNGPVVDVAKAVNLLVCKQADDLRFVSQGQMPQGPLKPFLMVASCDFNGLETTNTLTLDNQWIVSDLFYPDVIFLDARITIGCSAESLAQTGIIALCQAYEAMTAQDPNPMTEALAHPALGLLADYMAGPSNDDACLTLCNAAVMAAAAHSNAPPGMAFLLSQALSRATDIAPGIVMAAVLGAVVKKQQRQQYPVNETLLLALAGPDGFAAVPEQQRSRHGLEFALSLIQRLTKTLPASLRALNIQRHILDQVARDAAAQSGGRFTAEAGYSILVQADEDLS